jgi:hypothetical protein
MAAITITANNTRIDDAEAVTGYTSIGGGPGGAAEASFPYQGSLLFNRKITSSSGAGFYYTPTGDGGSAQDMTTTSKSHMMIKLIVTDYGGLNTTDGLVIRIGDTTTTYYDLVAAGSAAPVTSMQSYPVQGGFIIVPMNPNVAGYRNATTGTPDLTSVDYIALVGKFAASTAKSENVGLDAIDLGTGLTMVGGEAADTDGVFEDFRLADEGTTANRWGYVTSANGILNVFGRLKFGTASGVCIFDDSNKTIVFPDGMFDVGFSGLEIDLGAASDISIDSCTFLGRGDTTTVDTRPILTATSSTGTFSSTSCTYDNFNEITLSSACTITGGVISKTKKLYQNGSTLDGVTINAAVPGVGVAFVESDNPSNIKNSVFNFSEGHAFEITTAGTYTLDNLKFNGYGSNETTSSAIYNNSGGAVTLNLSGGTSLPTVKNGTSATTTIPTTSTLTLTGLVNPSEVRIFDNASPQTEVGGQETITTGTYTLNINISTYPSINIAILDAGATPAVKNIFLSDIDMSSGDVTLPIQQQVDRQYNNP